MPRCAHLTGETKIVLLRRFRKLEPKLNKIVDDVAGSYDNEVPACRTQAKSIAAETAALDEARYEREREAGVSGPLDPEFAEMVALRTERRQLQVCTDLSCTCICSSP